MTMNSQIVATGTVSLALLTAMPAQAGNQLLVPAGFGHGFCTLEPDTHVGYKVSGQYAPSCERAIIWNDSDLNIAWPTAGIEPTLSAKDQIAPTMADQPDLFE